jgi:hypothetical protein
MTACSRSHCVFRPDVDPLPDAPRRKRHPMTKSIRYGGPAAAMIFAVALPACTAAQVNQAASDIGLINAGIAAFLASPAAASIPSATLTQIKTHAADLQSAASTVATNVTAVPDASTADAVVSDVNAIVAAAAALPPGLISAPAPELLAAANALLPSVEALVGLLRGPLAAAPAMSPDRARAVLAAVKK